MTKFLTLGFLSFMGILVFLLLYNRNIEFFPHTVTKTVESVQNYVFHNLIINSNQTLSNIGINQIYFVAIELGNPIAQGTILSSMINGYYTPISKEILSKKESYQHIPFPFRCAEVEKIHGVFNATERSILGNSKHRIFEQCLIKARCKNSDLIGSSLLKSCEK